MADMKHHDAPEESLKLNIAGKLAQAFIHSKTTLLMVMFVL